MDIHVRKMGNAERRYLNEFWRLDCAPDLLIYKLFPNVKEVTESFGAFRAVAKYLELDREAPIQLVAVGDGCTPRTAGLFAFRTRWHCHSVDPRLRDKTIWGSIHRLTLHRCQIEEVALPATDTAVLVAVHSHAKLPVSLNAMKARRIHVVAIECCVPLRLPRKPDVDYLDMAIWSPMNRIRIWRDVQAATEEEARAKGAT